MRSLLRLIAWEIPFWVASIKFSSKLTENENQFQVESGYIFRKGKLLRMASLFRELGHENEN